jgi:phospholipase C
MTTRYSLPRRQLTAILLFFGSCPAARGVEVIPSLSAMAHLNVIHQENGSFDSLFGNVLDLRGGR